MLWFSVFFSDLHYVRWGNKTAKLKIPWIIFCHIYSSLCSPTYLHATLCPLGKQLFTQKLKLYSLEASSHKHFHTESHSLYSFFCKCRFSLSARLWAYSQSGKQKKITNWMKRWNTRCSSHTATQSAHLHLAQDAERSEKQPADTPHKHFGGREVGIRGNTPSCRELEVSHCRQQSKLQHHLRAQTNYWRKTASGKGQRTQTWEEGEKLCLSATSCTISPNVIDVGHMCDLQRKSTYKNIYGSYFLLPCWNFQI